MESDEVAKHQATQRRESGLDEELSAGLNERAYASGEVAKTLGVTTSTIRKYSIALEQRGHDIIRNDHNRRLYLDKDVTTLRNVMEYVTSGLSVEKAVKAVVGDVESVPAVGAPARDADDGRRNSDVVVGRLMEYIEGQDQQARELSGKLDYLIDKLQERDEREQERLLVESEKRSKWKFWQNLFEKWRK